MAAYVRVSTDNDEQTSSYELQKSYYTEYITGHPGWELVGVYADEGISGTSIAHRKGMLQMIEDCKAGKIDLIMTKSIARFARNIIDCLSVVDLLKNLEPPVGVQFEADNIYTLDNNGRMILTILASLAEEESHTKSVIMNWSIDRRFRRGLFLTPELLGYDRDEEGNLVINQDEASTVKVIYYLYLNGFSLKEIADTLTSFRRKTKAGNVEWSAGALAGIIANERHCGDILGRKTYTPNFLTHKAKKNKGERTQYRRQDHHEPIVCMQRQISFRPLVPMRRKPDPYQFLVSLTMVFSVDMFRWIRIGLDFQQMRFKRLQKVLCVIRQRCSWQRTKLDLICGAMKWSDPSILLLCRMPQ